MSFVIWTQCYFLLHIRGFKSLLIFYFRVEEKFAGGKFRVRKISRNSIRSGYYFRGRKISGKIKIRENSETLLHAKNWCYTVLPGKCCVKICFEYNFKSDAIIANSSYNTKHES